MKFFGWVIALCLLLVVGCQSRTAKIVGKWKAEPVKVTSSPNLSDVSRSAMLSLFSQNLEIEFNDKGQFKFGGGIMGGEGTYEWRGSVLELRTMGPNTLKFKFEGSDLVEVTDFDSDAKLRLKKIPKG